MTNKNYRSEKWLRRRYLQEKKTPEEIGKECGVSHMTVYRYINQFGLKR